MNKDQEAGAGLGIGGGARNNGKGTGGWAWTGLEKMKFCPHFWKCVVFFWAWSLGLGLGYRSDSGDLEGRPSYTHGGKPKPPRREGQAK